MPWKPSRPPARNCSITRKCRPATSYSALPGTTLQGQIFSSASILIRVGSLMPSSVPEDWEEWLATADDGTVSMLIKMMNDWINDTPDERDYESADLGGYSGRGHALRFFRDDFAYGDDFNIVVVEGDCPG